MNDYYAHGVGPETVKGPAGWEGRLVPVREPLRGATGWCLEPHDLVLSKCVAGRENDWRFAEEALRHGLVEIGLLRERAQTLPLTSRAKAALARELEGRASRAAEVDAQ